MAGYTQGVLPGQTSAGSADAFVRQYTRSGVEGWTHQFGSSSIEYAYAVATDDDGHVDVAGQTLGTLPGQTSAGGYDNFLRQYDGNGNEVWTRQFGGTSSEAVSGVAVDAAGDIYLAGLTYGTLPGQTSAGDKDGYLAVLSQTETDETAPVTTASVTPEPNVNGWNNSPVTVTLQSSDEPGGSGVEATYSILDGNPRQSYTGPIAVTLEGVHTLQYWSVDVAENVETAHSLTLRIDTKAPEVALAFDPASRDLSVTATDDGSGIPSTVLASRAAAAWTAQDSLPAITTTPSVSSGGLFNAELRTYVLTDRAGNTLTVVVKVQKIGGPAFGTLNAHVVSVRYGSGPPYIPTGQLQAQWIAAGSANPLILTQHFLSGSGMSRQERTTLYTGSSTTVFDLVHGGSQRLSGMALPQLHSSQGTLHIDLP